MSLPDVRRTQRLGEWRMRFAWRRAAAVGVWACALLMRPPALAGAAAYEPESAFGQQTITAPAPPVEQLSPEVRRAVDDAIASRLKDAKVVDVETTQAIASRFADWTKLFAFFVGIPLTILLATLGFLGLRTYKDFSTRVIAARDDALKRLADSRAEAETIDRDFEALRARLAEITTIASQVRELSQKVADIEQVVRFKASPALTPTLKDRLETSLTSYAAYLRAVGLTLKLRTPTVVIDAKILNAYYVPAPKNQIVIHPELAPYPDAPLREFTHHVLGSLKAGSLRGAGAISGLESGLADYLPSSFLDRSDFGRDIWPIFARQDPDVGVTSRDLNNQLSFSEAVTSTTEHHLVGTVWGGALWELRTVLGRETIDRLLLAAWREFNLTALKHDLAEFPRALLHQDAVLNQGAHESTIVDVFRRRGLDPTRKEAPSSDGRKASAPPRSSTRR